MVAYVGRQATISEPKPINTTADTIDARRPRRSAMRPKTQLPRGRMKKPRAKIPAVLSSCDVESPFGKNAAAKYSDVNE